MDAWVVCLCCMPWRLPAGSVGLLDVTSVWKGVSVSGALGNCRAASCVLHSDQAGAGGWQGMLS